ncbi:hypothetical protein [Allorhodopirellula solitaria]|uniref:hypothetical protein n=1 Tax=Allorhodopirellula solitaria TaxID=2527987 RepID=UPI0016467526|nr:hypothetical protein [Allorhodopirellula solitaria]
MTLTRLIPEILISKSSVRPFGVTVIVTRRLISLTHELLELLDELLDELLPATGPAGIVKPVLTFEGSNTAEHAELLLEDEYPDELLEDEQLDELPIHEELDELPPP